MTGLTPCECLGCTVELPKAYEELTTLRADKKKLLSDLGLIRRIVNETPEEEPFVPFDLRETERIQLIRALNAADGNRQDAAKILGVARSTMFQMIKRHGIRDRRSRKIEWR